MLSFTTAHVAVVALRLKDPTAAAVPGAVERAGPRSSDVPLTAVLGAIGTFAAWISVVVLHDEARTVGHARGWSVGIAGYVVYRAPRRAWT